MSCCWCWPGVSMFAGWIMKISHARKELNLPSEGLSTIVWRVAVRLVVPLAVVFVLSGYVA
jgi:SNF family Na+-dependent transporter